MSLITPFLSHCSVPGGKKSAEDSSLEEAALRETKEEIGLDMNLVNVLAFIGPFVSRVSTVFNVSFDYAHIISNLIIFTPWTPK